MPIAGVKGMVRRLHEMTPGEAELLLQQLIENAYDGIYITDAEGRTEWYNQAFLRISGLSPEQLDNHTVHQLLANGWIPNSCVIKTLESGQSANEIIKYYNGSEALVTSVPVYNDDGRLIRVIANVRDLSELNRLRRELERSQQIRAIQSQTLEKVTVAGQEGKSFVYQSDTMEKIVDLAMRIANFNTPVLLLGESGVGKDVLAHFIHQLSERSRTGSFVKINCGAIPENLLESELFGYEAGAFTGARQKGKPGLFEVAHQGTLFLDEIGEIPLSIQVKLLGVLQDGKIQRVGGLTPIDIDARVITATNANLLQLVQERRFRKDLYYRINVISISIPPLRERPEDILALILFFLKEFNQKYHSNKTMDAQLIKAMLEYSWPGNVRELRNTVERLVVVSEGDHIGLDDLPEPIQEEIRPLGVREALEAMPQGAPDIQISMQQLQHAEGLRHIMERLEKEVLAYYLQRYRPLKVCAERLGIDLSTLMRKKKRYGL